MRDELADTTEFNERICSAQRILIVAPHPDDESLGCGGLIATFVPTGRDFHFLFVTDGGASHTNSHKWLRERLAHQRREEAETALAVLGAGDHARTFLNLADAAMPTPGTADWVTAVKTVSALVQSFRPELTILPWRRDPHCDHRNSWSLVTEAIRACGLSPHSLEYAIWLDELGDADDYPRQYEAIPFDFDIAGFVAIKTAAVAAHRTQTTNLIADDPEAFRLTPETIGRLTGPRERYWRVLA